MVVSMSPAAASVQQPLAGYSRLLGRPAVLAEWSDDGVLAFATSAV